MNSLISILKQYVALYSSPLVFIGHKVTHIVVGALVVMSLMHVSVALSVLVLVVVAVGKEVADHLKAGVNDLPLYAHVFDVIITCIGGVLGALLLGVL